MSSFTLSLSGRGSELNAYYHPPIELDHKGEYVCGLVDFQTYMSIPNVNERNNSFIFLAEHQVHLSFNEAYMANIRLEDESTDEPSFENYEVLLDYVSNKMRQSMPNALIESIESIHLRRDKSFIEAIVSYYKRINIPTGSYEFDDLAQYLRKQIAQERGANIEITANKNTLKCSINATMPIRFDSRKHTIGSLLGFSDCELHPNQWNNSDEIIRISSTNAIKIETNITTGAYSNGELMRTLHTFYPVADSGYKIVEVPQHIIYLPVAVRSIHSFCVRMVDQDNNLIDFRNETVTLRVHIKRLI